MQIIVQENKSECFCIWTHRMIWSRYTPLMGGLLNLVHRVGDWAGSQPAQAPPRCTKWNSPLINGQCNNHRIADCKWELDYSQRFPKAGNGKWEGSHENQENGGNGYTKIIPAHLYNIPVVGLAEELHIRRCHCSRSRRQQRADRVLCSVHQVACQGRMCEWRGT